MNNNTMSAEEKQAIQQAMEQISSIMRTIEEGREDIKEIISTLSEQCSISKKLLRKMARTYHTCSFNTEQSDFSEYIEVYEEIFNPTNAP